MRHSIRMKITCLLIGLIVFTIFMFWLMNRFFLSDYYLYSKMETLGETYYKIEEIYKKENNKGILSSDSILKLEQLSTAEDVVIYVFANNLVSSFPTQENFSQREYLRVILTLQEYMFHGSNPQISDKNVLREKDTYTIFSLYDQGMESNYIDLIGVIEEDNMVFLRSNLESIQESVAIVNKFLGYIGIVTILLGTIAIMIMARKFTNPILELAEIAKKMSDLDFNVKYQRHSQDEIGELGESINSLSEKLEGTISDLKNANNELLKDIQQKEEIDEMRKEFLSNVSHELKTPLALIQGYAEGLKENINDDEESRDFYCEVIMDEANKMNRMVQKLLVLNELEFGNNKIYIERFDVVELIRNVVNSSEILFQQKKVTVYFDYTEPIYVWSDEQLIEQVVTNFITNALNHVRDPHIIEVKLVERDDVVRVAIFNTGLNIPEADINKIWDKFYKVDKARTREYGGSGIGLSIVKAIMNTLNGNYGVINRPLGVEFWIELDTKI